MLFDALLKNYQGMTFGDALRLTLPQIIMLNHSAAVNKERADEFFDWKESFKGHDKKKPKKRAAADEGSSKTEVFEGKTVDQLDSDSFNRYFWANIM